MIPARSEASLVEDPRECMNFPNSPRLAISFFSFPLPQVSSLPRLIDRIILGERSCHDIRSRDRNERIWLGSELRRFSRKFDVLFLLDPLPASRCLRNCRSIVSKRAAWISRLKRAVAVSFYRDLSLSGSIGHFRRESSDLARRRKYAQRR
jgi:hypothetical protein